MKKVLVLLALVLGATNIYAQDYDLKGLEKICDKALEISNFHGGRAKIVLEENGNRVTCFIDTKGNVVFNAKQKGIKESEQFSDEGLIVFSSSSGKGFLDINGNVAIPAKYTEVGTFLNGLAWVSINHKLGLIDKNGKVVIPLEYEGFMQWNDKFIVAKKNGDWGLLDKNNQLYPHLSGILPKPSSKDGVAAREEYGRRSRLFRAFGSGLSKSEGGLFPCAAGDKWATTVFLSNGAKMGFCNHLGKVVIPCTYDRVNWFREGVALVVKNGKSFYIDNKGNVAINTSDDLVAVGDFYEGLAKVRKGDLYGYIDKTGKNVIPCIFQNAESFHDGMALVGNSKYYTYINKEGKTITDFVFDYTTLPFSNGLALVSFQGKKGFIDKKGNSTFPSLIINDIDLDTHRNEIDCDSLPEI